MFLRNSRLVLRPSTAGQTYSRAVDGTSSVPFSSGNGSELDDMAGVVLLEVCEEVSGVMVAKQ
jgi:hypothetical protein